MNLKLNIHFIKCVNYNYSNLRHKNLRLFSIQFLLKSSKLEIYNFSQKNSEMNLKLNQIILVNV